MRGHLISIAKIPPGVTDRRRKVLLIAALGSALVAAVVTAQAGDSFFETNFDGAWSGTVTLATGSGKEAFPIAVNVDVTTGGGAGYLLLADSLDAAPSGTDLIPLDGVSASAKKLTLTATTPEAVSGIEAGFTHTLKLSYKAKSGTLKGTLTSTDPSLGKGRVALVRGGADRPVQGIWTGNANIGGGRGAVILQLEQDEATTGRGREATTGVGGSAIVGDEFGSIENGTFDGTNLLADVRTDTDTLRLALKLKNRTLRGRIDATRVGAAAEASLKLLPAGARGKAPSLTGASPSELEIGTRTEVTVRGKNLAPGSLLHTDVAGVSVADVEIVGTRVIRAALTPDEGLAEGVEVAVRVVGPDGASAERAASFRTVGGGGGTTVSFASQIQPVFTASCALSGCHTGANAAQGMDLSTGSAFGSIVGVPSNQMPALSRIAPGDPDNSYLIRKIKGQGIVGSRMPIGGGPLGDDIITLFETWAREGAQNN